MTVRTDKEKRLNRGREAQKKKTFFFFRLSIICSSIFIINDDLDPLKTNKKPFFLQDAPSTATTSVVDLRVDMACSGCSSAVQRVLEATPGVSSVSIDLAAQKVSVGVTPGTTAADVLAAVEKSGKKASFWA